MRIGGHTLLGTSYLNISTRTGVCQVIGSIWARMSLFSLKEDILRCQNRRRLWLVTTPRVGSHQPSQILSSAMYCYQRTLTNSKCRASGHGLGSNDCIRDSWKVMPACRKTLSQCPLLLALGIAPSQFRLDTRDVIVVFVFDVSRERMREKIVACDFMNDREFIILLAG